jgi:hypothetical protein
MPLRLNLGISKKQGQPNYGSLGASCHVEVELDQSLLFDDVESLQERIMQAFDTCRAAVDDELARQQTPHDPRECETRDNRRTLDRPAQYPHSQAASSRQQEYAKRLANQIRGCGEERLAELAATMFDKPLGSLSSLEASGLIDTLKDIRLGRIELTAALPGAAA